jgi:hypothetical protein
MATDSNVTPIIDSPAAEMAPARDDATPPPAPSSGSDVAPTAEEKPVIPVTVADGPPAAPRRGWWSRA